MPKVVITWDTVFCKFLVERYKGQPVDPEFQAVMDMKSSHYLNMKRNQVRVDTDQENLKSKFIQAQETGREFRER